MKRFFLLVFIAVVAVVSIHSHVTIPFDVTTPKWTMLVEPKDVDNPPIAFEKPNASSNVLVSQCGEDCEYQWASQSAIPEWWEIVKLYDHYPLKSNNDNRWACLEFNTGYESFPVYTPSGSLRKIQTYSLTEQDVINSSEVLAWKVGNDYYMVTYGSIGPGYVTIHIGKFVAGFLVFPYSCTLNLDYTASFPGILNGTVSDNCGLEKFTRRDIDYLLNHAEADTHLFGYGVVDSDGSKRIGWLKSDMITDNIGTQQQLDENIYSQVETEPVFPGGLSSIMSHIAKHQKYPLIAQENNIQGRILVQFVIEKDGSVTNVRVLKGVDPSLDNEAIRVIKTLPKFTSPGKINGRPVRTQMCVPVTFRLR